MPIETTNLKIPKLTDTDTFNTTTFGNIVDAIDQNAVSHDEIGILSDLQTTDKSSLVAAINEVKTNSSSSAADTSIADAGGYFNSANTEGALQEIGQTLNAMRGNLVTSANNILGA